MLRCNATLSDMGSEPNDFALRDRLSVVRIADDTAESVAQPFIWRIRVYYEDTDSGGVVYYANYLKFFERCRTECLRALGVDQSSLVRDQGLQFAVVRIETEYLQPARLDDELVIEARVTRLGPCSIDFDQVARRAGELLARTRVRVACVDSQRRLPARLPASLHQRIRAHAGPKVPSR
jgi:acyl-CoA thioester hydrolase